jgi:hypothetical protein
VDLGTVVESRAVSVSAIEMMYEEVTSIIVEVSVVQLAQYVPTPTADVVGWPPA